MFPTVELTTTVSDSGASQSWTVAERYKSGHETPDAEGLFRAIECGNSTQTIDVDHGCVNRWNADAAPACAVRSPSHSCQQYLSHGHAGI